MLFARLLRVLCVCGEGQLIRFFDVKAIFVASYSSYSTCANVDSVEIITKLRISSVGGEGGTCKLEAQGTLELTYTTREEGGGRKKLKIRSNSIHLSSPANY